MKAILVALFLFFVPISANAIHIVSKDAKIDITTNKISHIKGGIDPISTLVYFIEWQVTEKLSGPRVVLIDSPGGYVEAGNQIIEMMMKEQEAGIKQICVVQGMAASMAFNILSHCDVRLAEAPSRLLFHKVAIGQLDPSIRGTAKTLRMIADELDKVDAPLAEFNAKALNMSLMIYNKLAEGDWWWSVPEMMELKYLNGIAEVK